MLSEAKHLVRLVEILRRKKRASRPVREAGARQAE